MDSLNTVLKRMNEITNTTCCNELPCVFTLSDYSRVCEILRIFTQSIVCFCVPENFILRYVKFCEI